jgi:GNAT superfamily N-acetyltransferase
MPETRTFLRPDGRRFVVGSLDGELPSEELFATTDESDVERLRELEDLGFSRERRELHLMLPAKAARLPAPPGVDAVHADAVDEETLRLLDDELRQDVPGTDGWRWAADDFREETYRSPHFDPAVYLVATAEGEHVGICRVWIRPEYPRLGFIGVRSSLRQRGIARWLIGETFAVLHARGEREVGRPRRRCVARAQAPFGASAVSRASSNAYLTIGCLAARTSSSRLTGR